MNAGCLSDVSLWIDYRLPSEREENDCKSTGCKERRDLSEGVTIGEVSMATFVGTAAVAVEPPMCSIDL